MSDDGHAHVIVGTLIRPLLRVRQQATAFDGEIERQNHSSFCKSGGRGQSNLYYRSKFTGEEKVNVKNLKKLDMTALHFQNLASLLSKIKEYRDDPVGIRESGLDFFEDRNSEIITMKCAALRRRCKMRTDGARENEKRASRIDRPRRRCQSNANGTGEIDEIANAIRAEVREIVGVCKEYVTDARKILQGAERFRNNEKDYKESTRQCRESAERLREVVVDLIRRAGLRCGENDTIRREADKKIEITLYMLSKVAQSSTQNQEIVNTLYDNWPSGSISEGMSAVDEAFIAGNQLAGGTQPAAGA